MGGWAKLVKRKSTFAETGPAKTVAYAPATKMLIIASVPKVTVATTVNIMGRYVIKIHVNMEDPASAIPMEGMGIPAIVWLEQQESIVKKTQGMSVRMILARMVLNALIALGTMTATVSPNLEVGNM